jgi:hypothetical protein
MSTDKARYSSDWPEPFSYSQEHNIIIEFLRARVGDQSKRWRRNKQKHLSLELAQQGKEPLSRLAQELMLK